MTSRGAILINNKTTVPSPHYLNNKKLNIIHDDKTCNTITRHNLY